MLTALLLASTLQAKNPKLNVPKDRLVIFPKIAFLPTRSDYVSDVKYMKSKDAIDGAELGLYKPIIKPVPYTIINSVAFHKELVAAGMPKGAKQWNMGAADTAAKKVGAAYIGGVDIQSAKWHENKSNKYVVLKATVFFTKVNSKKALYLPMEATYFGPYKETDNSTNPTAREAAFMLGREVIPAWFAKNKAKLD